MESERDTCVRVFEDPEVEPYPCDQCKVTAGLQFVQGAWLCSVCRLVYLDQLYRESFRRAERCR